MKIKYYGRQGRRTKSGYRIVHVFDVDGKIVEITARTKTEAIQKAKEIKQ